MSFTGEFPTPGASAVQLNENKGALFKCIPLYVALTLQLTTKKASVERPSWAAEPAPHPVSEPFADQVPEAFQTVSIMNSQRNRSCLVSLSHICL
jgi:hypothetical protein